MERAIVIFLVVGLIVSLLWDSHEIMKTKQKLNMYRAFNHDLINWLVKMEIQWGDIYQLDDFCHQTRLKIFSDFGEANFYFSATIEALLVRQSELAEEVTARLERPEEYFQLRDEAFMGLLAK